MYEKVILITRKTPLQELIERLGTREQARFYLEQEHARFGPGGGGPNFAEYVAEDDIYAKALATLTAAIPRGVRSQVIERGFLPTFTFGERELVITLGADGLVVNAAKYLRDQPIYAVNPDPARIEGVMLPFSLRAACAGMALALAGRFVPRQLTMARASLADGQILYAVNDLFIGQRTHASARYRLMWGKTVEEQSSSGVLVSTGAGSTGWLRSAAVGATGIASALNAGSGPFAEDSGEAAQRVRFDGTAKSLRFCVREPWPSKTTAASLVYGTIGLSESLTIVSRMPQNGVIFSDGVESDYLPFDSGAVARVEIADRTVNLLVPG